MEHELITLNFLSIFALCSFFIALLIQKNSNQFNNGSLLDKDFQKPQAFHNEPIARSGGLFAIISLTIFFILNYFLFNKFYFDYVAIAYSLFLLGFLDDIKFNISAKHRLFAMVLILIICISFFSIEIERIDLSIINLIIQFKFLNILFVLLCFLFIINGSNLVDGFNGLLSIHLIIINTILMLINLNNNISSNFTIFIIAQIIILLIFLLFNFPKAKIFFGDSGSYLFGSLVVLNVIKTNNYNPEISSFFFCTILFYLFFEVFFSFFRKILSKKSPLKPDSEHLHMLIFVFLKKKKYFKKNNYVTSLLVNIFFCMMITPSLLIENNIFHLIWFFFSLFTYMCLYYFLLHLHKSIRSN